MKLTIRCLTVVVAVGCAFAGWNLSGSHVVLAEQKRLDTPVTMTRIFTGPDNMSHAEQIDVQMTRGRGGPNATDTSPLVKVTELQFQRTPPKYFSDFHPATERQYIFTMFGRFNYELSDGTIVRVYPGHVLLIEDLKGKGHIERGIGTDDHVTAVFSLPKE